MQFRFPLIFCGSPSYSLGLLFHNVTDSRGHDFLDVFLDRPVELVCEASQATFAPSNYVSAIQVSDGREATVSSGNPRRHFVLSHSILSFLHELTSRFLLCLFPGTKIVVLGQEIETSGQNLPVAQ